MTYKVLVYYADRSEGRRGLEHWLNQIDGRIISVYPIESQNKRVAIVEVSDTTNDGELRSPIAMALGLGPDDGRDGDVS